MTQKAAHLLAEALSLSEKERGDLAARLIESLDPDEDGDVESSWSAEIQKRIEELRDGRVQPLSWPEARRMILDDTDGPDPS